MSILTGTGPGPSSRSHASSSLVGGSCSRALSAIRSVRERLQLEDPAAEQRANFSPYASRKSNFAKPKQWSAKFVCLSHKETITVPCSKYDRAMLIEAGLGEKKVVVPNIDATPKQFQDVLIAEFPKLEGCGGYELLRCIPNTKQLEVISPSMAQSPKLLKNVLGNGRVFIRPIQRDLDIIPVTLAHSEEVMYYYVCILISMYLYLVIITLPILYL